MILTCIKCEHHYDVENKQIGFEGRKVRCVNCGHVWFQTPDGEPPESESLPGALSTTQEAIREREEAAYEAREARKEESSINWEATKKEAADRKVREEEARAYSKANEEEALAKKAKKDEVQAKKEGAIAKKAKSARAGAKSPEGEEDEGDIKFNATREAEDKHKAREEEAIAERKAQEEEAKAKKEEAKVAEEAKAQEEEAKAQEEEAKVQEEEAKVQEEEAKAQEEEAKATEEGSSTEEGSDEEGSEKLTDKEIYEAKEKAEEVAAAIVHEEIVAGHILEEEDHFRDKRARMFGLYVFILLSLVTLFVLFAAKDLFIKHVPQTLVFYKSVGIEKDAPGEGLELRGINVRIKGHRALITGAIVNVTKTAKRGPKIRVTFKDRSNNNLRVFHIKDLKGQMIDKGSSVMINSNIENVPTSAVNAEVKVVK